MTLVAPGIFVDPSSRSAGFLVGSSSAIKSPKDLAGKIVGVSALQNSFSVAVMAWLDQSGVDPMNGVKFVEIPPNAVAQAIAQGRIDGGVTYEPLLTAAVNQGARILGFPFEVFGRRSEVSAYYADAGWIASHREPLQRFNRVLRDATQYVMGHESETVP